jgi:hypothetical protein
MTERPTTQELERAVAVLHQAVAVLRGMLYSARSGDTTKGEMERLLDSTNGETLARLIGPQIYQEVMALSDRQYFSEMRASNKTIMFAL